MRIEAGWLRATGPTAVFNLLEQAGYKAYFVGGCVRNALLEKPISDIDMATDALPETVMTLAKDNGLRTIPTGIEHGTVTFLVDEQTVEVTTFRKDIKTDGRRAVVVFSAAMEDDAKRRDFTMNALYADRYGTILDPLGGLKDLRAGRVLFIENPEDRIREDYLRILRFFRFHALYGNPDAGIDADALNACAQNLDGIDNLSKERIGHEIRRLLGADNPAPSIAAMAQTGVLNRVIKGADHCAIAPLVHLERSLDLPPSWMRRLLALGGQDVKDALRLSKHEARLLAAMRIAVTNALSPRIAAYKLGFEAAQDAFLVLCAHLGNPLPTDLNLELSIGAKAKFPVGSIDLAGNFSGPALGARLKRLETTWISSGLQLSKDELLSQD
ncbi:MAG: CCA tRNA nucleotidyltransferase [Proteobacteria bacterium]|nr:CCA tRNA nucleotidyltransferase [Pseudomonadota bacterium]